MNLHERGIVDDEYLAEHSQIDGKEKLIERMLPIYIAKREALLAQAQQAAVPEEGGPVGNAL